MFGILIESMATPQRRTGGSAASLLAHAALIGGAVFATAGTKRAPTVSASDVHNLVYHVTVVPPPESPPLRTASQTAAPAAPSLPALHVPTIIPSTIPPIDFSLPATPMDFNDRRSHEAGDGCSGICDTHGPASEAPTWVGNDVVMQLREQIVPPRYPERLRQAGVEGRVVAKFVVDTLGRVDQATIEIMESTHDLFTATVRETLARLRFNPAMSGSRKVRATAMMPFEFRIR